MVHVCTRRELLRVPADQLLEILARQPERLWKRVWELEAVPKVIVAIRQMREGTDHLTGVHPAVILSATRE
jgi:hypothetical protein